MGAFVRAGAKISVGASQVIVVPTFPERAARDRRRCQLHVFLALSRRA